MYRVAQYLAVVSGLLSASCKGQDLKTSTTTPIADLGYARYRGNTSYRADFNTDVYYGIRYAQAPIGDLRWRAPLDIEANNNYSLDDVIDAQGPSTACVQGTPTWRSYAQNIKLPVAVVGEEDCLIVDVYVPTNPKSTALPVLVDLPGGGYTQGSANAFVNRGQALVGAANGSMIYVSAQYRLGGYGFLSSVEVKQDGAANAGLLDARSALNWVQRVRIVPGLGADGTHANVNGGQNIHAFGGDASKTTLIGGSAGGGVGE
jgi:carboxylesterase type B